MKIAVVGTGAVGALISSYLAKANKDITMISIHRKSQAEQINQLGLTMEGYGNTFHCSVHAEYLPEIKTSNKYDLIFLTNKSNTLEEILPWVSAHIAPSGYVIQCQNGINDEKLKKNLPNNQIMTAVLFCGGAQLEPGRYMNHDGHIYLGTAGEVKPGDLQKVAAVLGNVRKVYVVDDIRSYQWDKLARVCLSVPTATVSGLYLGSVFKHPKTQKMFALLALELFSVSRADHHPLERVEGKSESTWIKIRDGELTGLEGREQEPDWPDGIVDAYTKDIRNHQPLEVYFTNGAVVEMGRKYAVDTSANQKILEHIQKIEKGEEEPSIPLLEKIISESKSQEGRK